MNNRVLNIMCLFLVCVTAVNAQKRSAHDKPQHSSRSAVEQEFGHLIAREERKAKEERKAEKAREHRVEAARSAPRPAPQPAPQARPDKLPKSMRQQALPVVTIAASAPRSVRRSVDEPRVTVRANHGGYAIGTLFGKDAKRTRAQTFRLDDVRGKWGVGRAGGNVQKPGWVLMSGLGKGVRPLPDTPRDPILRKQKSRDFMLKHYAAMINPGRKDGTLATLERPVHVFGNYRFKDGKPLDAYGQRVLPNDPNVQLKWRWVTKDGRYVMTRVTRDLGGLDANGKPRQSNVWGYVRCSAIKSRLSITLPCTY